MRPSKPTPTTPLSVASQISQLPELAMADIKSLWQRLFHAANPTHNRQFLERRIAYKLQEIEFRKVDPGLLDRNKRRIENLIETGKVKTRDPDYRPVAGTMLTREYQGKEYRVIASQKVVDLFLEEEEQALAMASDFIGKPISLQGESGYGPEQYDIVLL